MLATPCYGGQTTHIYSVSLFSLSGHAARNGIDIFVQTDSTSDVFAARNRMAAMMLEDKSITHLYFVDGDLGFSLDQFYRPLQSDYDVVSVLYPLKKYQWPDKLPKDMTREQFEHLYTAYPFFPVGTQSDDDGFAEVARATTGFMCIKRHVIEQMVKANPKKYYERMPDGRRVGPFYDLFDPVLVGESRLTEDYAFCHAWRDLGGKVHVDCESSLDHLGQHIFHGDLGGSLIAKNKQAHSEAA